MLKYHNFTCIGVVHSFLGFLTIFYFGYQFLFYNAMNNFNIFFSFFFLFFDTISLDYMSAPDSKDLQWHHSVMSLLSLTHMLTLPAAEKCRKKPLSSIALKSSDLCLHLLENTKLPHSSELVKSMLNHMDCLPERAHTIPQCF